MRGSPAFVGQEDFGGRVPPSGDQGYEGRLAVQSWGLGNRPVESQSLVAKEASR